MLRMHYLGVPLITSIIMFVPIVASQCVECNKILLSNCSVDTPGYHCQVHSNVQSSTLSRDKFRQETDTEKLYQSCVPYPFELLYLVEYCCFWSRDLGCSMALHQSVYDVGDPTEHCVKCKEKFEEQGRNSKACTIRNERSQLYSILAMLFIYVFFKA